MPGCRIAADSPLRIRNVQVLYYITTTFLVIWSFSFGSTFDAYLLELGKKNSFVGSIESVRGMVALVAAFPLGILSDKLNRRRVLQSSTLVGTVGVALLASGILNDSVGLLYAGVVSSALYMQIYMSCGQALLADSVPKEKLTTAIAYQSSLYLLGYSVGPLAQIVVISRVGDTWTLSRLHVFLSVGFVLWPALVLAFPFLQPTTQELERQSQNELREGLAAGAAPTPATGQSRGSARQQSASTSGQANGATLWYEDKVLGIRKKWLVPVLIELGTLVTAMGAGMTVKFFPLFFKEDYDFAPIQLCSLNAGYTVAIALMVQVCRKVSDRIGRCQAVLAWKVLGTLCLFLLWRVKPLPLVIFFHVLRGSLMNAAGPINQSIIMECVDSSLRGRWSALQSISRFSWSGSAILGGLLSDSHDYRYTFFITGLIYTVSTLLYVPLLFLVPSSKAGAAIAVPQPQATAEEDAIAPSLEAAEGEWEKGDAHTESMISMQHVNGSTGRSIAPGQPPAAAR